MTLTENVARIEKHGTLIKSVSKENAERSKVETLAYALDNLHYIITFVGGVPSATLKVFNQTDYTITKFL